jgi:hypothetical protein
VAIPAGIAPPRYINSLRQVRHQNESTETKRKSNECLTVLPWTFTSRSTVAHRPCPRFNGGMPALTRRRSPDHLQETWFIHQDNVRVGIIARRAGAPPSSDQWQWLCGLGLKPNDQRSGIATTFDAARAAFAAAWETLRTTADDLDAWRDQQAWTAEKYRRFDRHEPMPGDWRPGA